MTRILVEALGVLIALEVRGDDLVDAVRTAWKDATVDDGEAVTVLTVAVDGADDSRAGVGGSDVAEVLHRLSPAVTHAVLDDRAGDLVLLHAAALADPDTGATAVLVAASGTGKTTACRTLATDLVYLSDETAGITQDGRVLPYRKPLSIVTETHVKDQVAPSDLGLRTDAVEGRARAVLHLERDPGHVGPPIVVDVDTIDAFPLLAPQASALARTQRPLHRVAEVLKPCGGLKRVRYAEAETLLPVVRAALAGGSA